MLVPRPAPGPGSEALLPLWSRDLLWSRGRHVTTAASAQGGRGGARACPRSSPAPRASDAVVRGCDGAEAAGGPVFTCDGRIHAAAGSRDGSSRGGRGRGGAGRRIKAAAWNGRGVARAGGCDAQPAERRPWGTGQAAVPVGPGRIPVMAVEAAASGAGVVARSCEWAARRAGKAAGCNLADASEERCNLADASDWRIGGEGQCDDQVLVESEL